MIPIWIFIITMKYPKSTLFLTILAECRFIQTDSKIVQRLLKTSECTQPKDALWYVTNRNVNTPHGVYWMGLRLLDGVWTWADGSALNVSIDALPWNPARDPAHECALFYSTEYMAITSDDCTTDRHVICQTAASSNRSRFRSTCRFNWTPCLRCNTFLRSFFSGLYTLYRLTFDVHVLSYFLQCKNETIVYVWQKTFLAHSCNGP